MKEDEKRFDSDYLNTFQKGFAESDKNEKLPGRFYRCSTEGGFGACADAGNFFPVFIFTFFSNRGKLCQYLLSSRSVGKASASRFAALNLTHYLIECYTEVMRTQ